MDFTMWMLYLDEEENRCTKQDYYLAQIATVMERTVSKDPVQVKKYLLKYEKKKKTHKKVVNRETIMESQKLFWFASLGLDKDGNIT